MSTASEVQPSDLELVGSSVVQAAEALGLSREALAAAIGVSVPTVARMRKGAAVPNHKPFELSLILIRVYRALYAIVGGDSRSMKHWMKTRNHHLSDASPCELVQKVDGLTQVMWYLDAMRGKI